jgi:hypothetical protein
VQTGFAIMVQSIFYGFKKENKQTPYIIPNLRLGVFRLNYKSP